MGPLGRATLFASLLLANTLLASAQETPASLVLRFGWAPQFCYDYNNGLVDNHTAPFCGGATPFNAFRVNRLYGATESGKTIQGVCTEAAPWSSQLVPKDLLPELGCVWYSYAEPNNDMQLWEAVWNDTSAGGSCTGLAQDQWMRLALELRDKYNIDMAFQRMNVSMDNPTGADLEQALLDVFGKRAHVQCSKSLQLSSISLCFNATPPHAIIDCTPGTCNNSSKPFTLPQGVPIPEQCIKFYEAPTPPSPPSPAPAPSPAPQPSSAPSPAPLPSPAPSPRPPPHPSPPFESPAPVASPGGQPGQSPVSPSLPASPSPSPSPNSNGTTAGAAAPFSNPDSLAVGAILGIVAGALVAVVGLLGFVYWRQRRKRRHHPADGSVTDDSNLEAGGGPGGPKPSSTGTSRQAMPSESYRAASGSSGLGDPLLGYIGDQLSSGQSLSALTGPITPQLSSWRRSLKVDGHPWEIQWSELQILDACGEGSYGRVYRARWQEMVVAAKVLLTGSGSGSIRSAEDAQKALAITPRALMKLDEEAAIMASLRHPNVLNFLAMTRQPPCIITEYCARGSLCDVLARARCGDSEMVAALAWPRRLGMALDAAKGMLYLHSRQSAIIHRDLKSPNLLCDSHWVIKVSDFNLSRLMEDEGLSQTSSAAVLNPRWLAPEVMQGEHATAASDVFAFGTVLHELLTWQLPFSTMPGLNPWQQASWIIKGNRLPIPPRDELPGDDTTSFQGLEAYIALLQRCWAQEPVERPRFLEIVETLSSLLGDEDPMTRVMSGKLAPVVLSGASTGKATLGSSDWQLGSVPSPVSEQTTTTDTTNAGTHSSRSPELPSS